MSDIALPSWEDIALDDTFRNAEPAKQSEIRSIWLQDVAPHIYPGVNSDILALSNLRRFVYDFNAPPKLEDEDSIITPDTLSIAGFTTIEKNSLFASKNYMDQKLLKHLWFLKAKQVDPEMKSMTPEESQAFYGNLMGRFPSLASGLYPKHDPGEIAEELQEMSQAAKGAKSFISNLTSSLLLEGGALVIAPLRWIAGDESGIANFIRDVEKRRDWLNEVNETNSFFTEGLPSFIGTALGFAAGPAGKIQKILSGGRRALNVGKGFERVPGLLEKGARTVGLSGVPPLLWQTAGGASAGIISGIARSITEDKDWKTYLATDASIGLGAEFVTRWFGASRAFRKVLKDLGKKGNVRDYLAAPFSEGSPPMFSAEAQKIIDSDPRSRSMFEEASALNQYGFSIDLQYSKPGVSFMSEWLGFKAEHGKDMITITRGGKEVAKFTGPESHNINRSIDFLDTQYEAHYETALTRLGNQNAWEHFYNQAVIDFKVTDVIPNRARQIIRKVLEEEKAGIEDYITVEKALLGKAIPSTDFKNFPRESTRVMDQIADRLQKVFDSSKEVTKRQGGTITTQYAQAAVRTVQKMKRTLDRMGIKISEQGVIDLKVKLEQIQPNKAYVATDKLSGTFKPLGEMPRVILDGPGMKTSLRDVIVGSGSQSQIKKILSSLNANDIRGKRAETIIVKESATGDGFISINRLEPSRVVEFEIKMLDDKGVARMVRLHLPSVREGLRLLSVGGTKGREAIIDEFAKINPDLKKAYENFLKEVPKGFAKTKDFLPFKFVAAQAHQTGYNLGNYRGAYILESRIVGEDGFHQFDSLTGVLKFLDENDVRLQAPDLMSNVPLDIFDAPGRGSPEKLLENLKNLDTAELTTNKKYAGFRSLTYRFLPVQHVMKKLEKMAIVKEAGLKPLEMYNDLRSVAQHQNMFLGRHNASIEQIFKGMKEPDRKFVQRWIEAFETVDEAKHAGFTNLQIEKGDIDLKSDLEKVMANEGRPINTIKETSAYLERYYDHMFSLSGMDWEKFVKHYHPRIRLAVQKEGLPVGGSSTYAAHADRIISSKTHLGDHTFFFEFTRNVHTKDFLIEKDAFLAAKYYTYMMNNKLHRQPILDKLEKHVDEVRRRVKGTKLQNRDFDAVHAYMTEVIDAVGGLQKESITQVQNATRAIMGRVANFANKKFNRKKKLNFDNADATNTMITLSTLSQLAAKPFLVLRNLTQSLLTGGSKIGIRWWAEGLDKTMNPNSLKHLYDIGVIDPSSIPHATSEAFKVGGILQKTVNIGMAPYKWADHVNRSIVYYGMSERVDSAVRRLQAGKIDQKQFIRDSGANLFGKAEYNEAVKILDKGKGLLAFRNHLALKAVDRTQYIYNSWDAPHAFRGVVGRFFGQYGTWPINFVNLISEGVGTGGLSMAQRAAFIGRLGVILGAIREGAAEAGIRSDSFEPLNMSFFTGGPYFDMTTNMLKAMDGDKRAIRSVIGNLKIIVPFSHQGEGIDKSLRAMLDGNYHEAFIHLMSATPAMDIFPRRESTLDMAEGKATEAVAGALSAVGIGRR